MPSGWKRRALSAVFSVLAPLVIPRTSRAVVRILNYHRINYPDAIAQFDDEVLSAPPELFEQEMRFCARHFDVLSFAELRSSLDGSLRLPRRPLIITFDDGYRDNYQHAFPILKSHNVKAMFFLAVGFIGTRNLFWWDAVARVVKSHRGQTLRCHVGAEELALDTQTHEARLRSLQRFLRHLKGVPNQVRVDAVNELAPADSSSEHSNTGGEIMSWSEVREMQAAGMEFGSHSMTHPVLARVEEEDRLRHEVAGSKAALEATLGVPISVFSYPVGGASAIRPNVVREVQRAGYRFAVSYIHGVNRPAGEMDPYCMRRLHVDGLGLTHFRARLAVPKI
jgi:peptidoglycan/xylan/chitin deacetylase (PgdA/CDA1 family)